MIGIYKITNPNGKIYIGQSVNIKLRFERYIKNMEGCKTQVKLYNSLKKYSPENHKFEILEECSLEQLNEREIYWGQYYNVLNKNLGLNLKLGKGKGSLSEETKLKIGNSLKGTKRSEETKLKMSLKQIGRKYTEHNKLKMSLSKKGKKFSEDKKINMKGKRCKPILQYDLQDNFIREWESFKQIKNELGYNNSSLCFCCKGIQKKSHGYKWKYKE